MREIADSERKTIEQARARYISSERPNRNSVDFEAGFVAGFVTALDHQQAKIDTLLAFVNGKITRRELQEVIGQ